MSAPFKGIGYLSKVAGTESTLRSMPCGGEATWRKPFTSQVQRIAALSGLVLARKLSSRQVRVCTGECIAVAHLPGQKAELDRTLATPRGWRKSTFTFADAEKLGVLLPGEQGLHWPQSSAENICLSPAQFVKEMHTGSDKHSGGAFAVSQQVLV